MSRKKDIWDELGEVLQIALGILLAVGVLYLILKGTHHSVNIVLVK